MRKPQVLQAIEHGGRLRDYERTIVDTGVLGLRWSLRLGRRFQGNQKCDQLRDALIAEASSNFERVYPECHDSSANTSAEMQTITTEDLRSQTLQALIPRRKNVFRPENDHPTDRPLSWPLPLHKTPHQSAQQQTQAYILSPIVVFKRSTSAVNLAIFSLCPLIVRLWLSSSALISCSVT